MKGNFYISILFVLVFYTTGYAQWPLLDNGRDLNPADRTMPYNHLDFSGELFNFIQGNLWQFKLSAGFSFLKDNHELSVDLPLIRSEYTGIENLSGLGDIKLNYKALTYESKLRVRTLASSSAYVSLSLPTGDEFSGHGAGVPIIIPGFRLAYRPVEQIAIYPDIHYTHSFGEANSAWGGGISGGVPDDPATEVRKIRSSQVEVFFNAELNEAWLGIAPVYSYDFIGKEGTLNIRPEIGKLFASSFSVKISGSFYVAGRRRLLSWTTFHVGYIF